MEFINIKFFYGWSINVAGGENWVCNGETFASLNYLDWGSLVFFCYLQDISSFLLLLITIHFLWVSAEHRKFPKAEM